VTPDRYIQALRGDAVQKKVEAARAFAQRTKIPGTPAMIINGQYLVQQQLRRPAAHRLGADRAGPRCPRPLNQRHGAVAAACHHFLAGAGAGPTFPDAGDVSMKIRYALALAALLPILAACKADDGSTNTAAPAEPAAARPPPNRRCAGRGQRRRRPAAPKATRPRPKPLRPPHRPRPPPR
jgi:hypothetical protein